MKAWYKDLFIVFCIICLILVIACLAYRTGYDSGYKLGSSLCPVIQHEQGEK